MYPYRIKKISGDNDPHQRYLDSQAKTASVVHYIQNEQPVQSVEINSASQLPVAPISHYLWSDHNYSPRAAACCAWYDKGLLVFLAAGERNPKTTYKQHQEPVYEDSCLEFFVCPDPGRSQVYLNFELNAGGALLLEYGTNRENRQQFDTHLRNKIHIKPVKHDLANPFWSVYLDIPADLLLYPLAAAGHQTDSVWVQGHQMAVNFYKCGDKTEHPHYGCWNLITSQHPDFHRPADFGTAHLV